MIDNNFDRLVSSFNQHYREFEDAASDDSMQDVVDAAFEALAEDFKSFEEELKFRCTPNKKGEVQNLIGRFGQIARTFPKKLLSGIFQEVHGTIKSVGLDDDNHKRAFLEWLNQFENDPIRYCEELKNGGYNARDTLCNKVSAILHSSYGEPSFQTDRSIFSLATHGEPRLSRAAVNMQFLWVLRNAGVDLNTRGLFDFPILEEAYARDDHESVKYLLSEGYNVGKLGVDSKMWKDFFGDGKTISQGIELLTQKYGHFTPETAAPFDEDLLCKAFTRSDFDHEDIEYLFSLGYTLQRFDQNGHHLLTYLFSIKHPKALDVAYCIKGLLFSIDEPDSKGRTALSYALENEPGAILPLVKLGANVNTVYQEYTVLGQFLLKKLGVLADFKGFIDQTGARTDIPFGKEKETPLIYAIRNEIAALIAFMLPYKEGVNVRDKDGKSALAHAFKLGGWDSIVTNLLNKGADQVDCLDSDGNTLIWTAWKDKNLKKLKLLLEKYNVPIDVVNSSGNTFLFQCLAEGLPLEMELQRDECTPLEFVQFALRRGANPFKRNRNGTPPFYLMLQKYPQLLPKEIQANQLRYVDDFGVAAIDLAFDYERIEIINKFLPGYKFTSHNRKHLNEVFNALLNHSSDDNNLQVILLSALMLNLKEVSFELQRKIGRDRFIPIFCKLIRNIPQSYWINHLLYVDVNHLHIKPPTGTLTTAQNCGEVTRFTSIIQECAHLSLVEKEVAVNFINTIVDMSAHIVNLKSIVAELETTMSKEQLTHVLSRFIADLVRRNPKIPFSYWMKRLLNVEMELDKVSKVSKKAKNEVKLKEESAAAISALLIALEKETIRDPVEFYPNVQNNVRHLLSVYDSFVKADDKLQQGTLLRNLVEIAKACPTRWYTGPIELLMAYQSNDLEKQKAIGFDGWYYDELNIFRRQIVELMAGPNAHHRGHYFQLLGNAARIYGYEQLYQFIDFMNTSHLITYELAEKQFIYRYNPSKLITFTGDRIKEHLKKDTSGHSDQFAFNRWLQNHLPKPYMTDFDQVVSQIEAKTQERVKNGETRAEEAQSFMIKAFEAYLKKRQFPIFEGMTNVREYLARVKLSQYIFEELYDSNYELQPTGILHVLSQLKVVHEVVPGTVKAVLEELKKPAEESNKRVKREEEIKIG